MTTVTSLSDAEALRALVHRDGKQMTAVHIGTCEMSVYRWLRQRTAPTMFRAVQSLRTRAATLTTEEIKAWRNAERASTRAAS